MNQFRLNKISLHLFYILLALLLISCGLTSAPEIGRQPVLSTLTPTPQPTGTFTPFPPSPPDPSPTRYLTATLAATDTATATPTVTSTSTPEPSATLTPTDLPPTPNPYSTVRFAVIGDYGLAGQAEEDVANLIKGWGPDFIITTGDNNYPNGASATIDENIGQYYHEYIYPYNGRYGSGATYNRFFPSLGNHDYITLGAEPYFEYFTLPGNERYYDFTWGPLHLFAINSDPNEPDGVGRSSSQAAWLRERMALSTLPWKIVYMHHAPYSSGYHGSTDWSRWPYKEWGASAVLAGHDHTYERLIVDDLPYFVNGLGGGPRYTFSGVYPGSQERFSDEYGAMLVTATYTELTFSFYTRHGDCIDIYTLTAP